MSRKTQANDAESRKPVTVLLRGLGSLKLAVVLLLVLAAVMSAATLVEASRGREYAQWYFYYSFFFFIGPLPFPGIITLLAALSVNILAATIVRFPWGWRRTGFLLAHAGLLVMLAGAVVMFRWGVHGMFRFMEGETSNTLAITDRSQITAQWQQPQGMHGQSKVSFLFQPGPVDWPEGKELYIGQFAGVSLKVLKFYRHAKVQEACVADDETRSNPAIKIDVATRSGRNHAEWLLSDGFGAEDTIDRTRIRFLQAPAETMAEDFTAPPAPETDKSGVLSAHYEGRMYRVPVGANVGKKVPLGDTKVSVEIVSCLANARPVAAGKFVSLGEAPKNPMVELKVHLPGGQEPMRQIAFAQKPLMSLDGIHGSTCPVKFWYHHPSAPVAAGFDFSCTPSGKMFARAAEENKYEPRGTVKAGDLLEIRDARVEILDFLRHARPEITFLPVAVTGDEGPGPAAQVEITAGGATEKLWLKQHDEAYGFQMLQTANGPLAVSFGTEQMPLDFSLSLLKFEQGMNPGGMGAASYSSQVRLIDKSLGIDEERLITMNEPLTHRGFTFYQSSFDRPRGGRAAMSILSVKSAPGETVLYTGIVLSLLGMLVLFCQKFAASPFLAFGSRTADVRMTGGKQSLAIPVNEKAAP